MVGIDLSPIQPAHKVPTNAEFIMMDLTDGLPFDEGSTDLIQSRFPFNLTVVVNSELLMQE